MKFWKKGLFTDESKYIIVYKYSHRFQASYSDRKARWWKCHGVGSSCSLGSWKFGLRRGYYGSHSV